MTKGKHSHANLCPTALLPETPSRRECWLHHSPPPLLPGPNFPHAATQSWEIRLILGGKQPSDFYIFQFGFLWLVNTSPGDQPLRRGRFPDAGEARALRATEEAKGVAVTSGCRSKTPSLGGDGEEGIGRRPPPSSGRSRDAAQTL